MDLRETTPAHTWEPPAEPTQVRYYTRDTTKKSSREKPRIKLGHKRWKNKIEKHFTSGNTINWHNQ